MAAQAEPRTGLQAGALVAGIYHVEAKVGEGASGEVWSAINTQNGIRVALKALFSSMIADEEVVARFRREAFFLARAKSDYVAKIYEFINDPVTGMVLVMEFIEGESLAQVFDRRILSVEESIEVGIDVLSGVVDLHEARIIHRDLKPANLLMQPQPDGRLRAVICDFSLSRLAKRRPRDSSVATALTELTRGDVALGTVRYMAPEQVLNSRQATERSDLYAVGAILFRGVAGVHAFSEYQTIRQIARAKVTGEARALDTGRKDPAARGLEAVISKALRRKPADRFQEATEMRASLLALATHAVGPVERETQQNLRAAPRIQPESSGSSSGSSGSITGRPIAASALTDAASSQSEAGSDGVTPRSQKLGEHSVQVMFDSMAPKARKRPAVLLVSGAVAIFAAGIFAGRFWSVPGPTPAIAEINAGALAEAPPVTSVAVIAPAPPTGAGSAAPLASASAGAVIVLAESASAAPAAAPVGSMPSSVAAAPAPPSTGSAHVGALADNEAPSVELPETPNHPEHHHHTAPAASASAGATGDQAQPGQATTANAGSSTTSPSAEAGAPVAAKAEAGAGSSAIAVKSKKGDDDDFENPYDTPGPAPRPAPKPKSDGSGGSADAGGSLGF